VWSGIGCDFKNAPIRGHGNGENKYSEVEVGDDTRRNRRNAGEDGAQREINSTRLNKLKQ